MLQVNLSRFDNSWYHPGRPRLVQALWFVLGLPLLRCSVIPSSRFRVWLLRLFGAKMGTGVVIKPGVRVKYPWHLRVGHHSWIGEDVWIDNLALVCLGHNVCVSQGAYLCTGNHDWSDPAFGLVTRPISLRDGCWLGARSVVCPGVEVGPAAVVVAGSVATRDLPAGEIHAGNPARFIKHRLATNSQPQSA